MFGWLLDNVDYLEDKESKQKGTESKPILKSCMNYSTDKLYHGQNQNSGNNVTVQNPM